MLHHCLKTLLSYLLKEPYLVYYQPINTSLFTPYFLYENRKDHIRTTSSCQHQASNFTMISRTSHSLFSSIKKLRISACFNLSSIPLFVSWIPLSLNSQSIVFLIISLVSSIIKLPLLLDYTHQCTHMPWWLKCLYFYLFPHHHTNIYIFHLYLIVSFPGDCSCDYNMTLIYQVYLHVIMLWEKMMAEKLPNFCKDHNPSIYEADKILKGKVQRKSCLDTL